MKNYIAYATEHRKHIGANSIHNSHICRTSELKHCLPVWTQSAALRRFLSYVAVVLYRFLWTHFCVGVEARLGRRILSQIHVRRVFVLRILKLNCVVD